MTGNSPSEKRLYHLESWQQALRVLQAMGPHERQEHFDMHDWGVQTDCGTVACIAGHCTLDPWFQTNRKFSPSWRTDGKLSVYGCDFMGAFGAGYDHIFFKDPDKTDHAEAVRMVKLEIARLGGESICRHGWGMP